MHAFWLVLTYDLLEDRRIDDVIIKTFLNSLLYKTNRFQLGIYLLNIFISWWRNFHSLEDTMSTSCIINSSARGLEETLNSSITEMVGWQDQGCTNPWQASPLKDQ